MEFARRALRDLIPTYESKPDIEVNQRVVSDTFHIGLTELKSKKRTQRVTFPSLKMLVFPHPARSA
jgi:chromosomal replication initiation ATPase DnaA